MSGESATPGDGRNVEDGGWPIAENGDVQNAGGASAGDSAPGPSTDSSSGRVGPDRLPLRPPNEVTARQRPFDVDGAPVADGSVVESPAITEVGDGVDRDWVAGVVTDGDPRVGEDLLPDHEFALCLTHDVDRPYKLAQALLYAVRDRDPGQLLDLLPGRRPNWTFDRVTSIEDDLGVRSAFYFLDEQRLLRDRPWRDWLDPEAWRLYADRYDVEDPPIVELIRRLHDGGWEVGLHGSYQSYDDRARLRREKDRIEAVLDEPIRGGRQHYLNRTLPETWEHHAAIGLEYDATLGSSSEFGFGYGDTVCRPFDDAFVAFPLTIMDVAVPDPGEEFAAARRACDRVMERAAERGAITTVLWHPRMFNERDWPGHASLYRHLIERAQDLGGWVGAPGELYEHLDGPG